MDNGPEVIAWALRGLVPPGWHGAVYIEQAAPWENPFVESFNGALRDEAWVRVG